MNTREKQLEEALDACLEIMTRAVGENLPVNRGTGCEEEDWQSSIRAGRNALQGRIFHAEIFIGGKYDCGVINKDGNTLAFQFTGNDIRSATVRQLVESGWISREDSHKVILTYKIREAAE